MSEAQIEVEHPGEHVGFDRFCVGELRSTKGTYLTTYVRSDDLATPAAFVATNRKWIMAPRSRTSSSVLASVYVLR